MAMPVTDLALGLQVIAIKDSDILVIIGEEKDCPN